MSAVAHLSSSHFLPEPHFSYARFRPKDAQNNNYPRQCQANSKCNRQRKYSFLINLVVCSLLVICHNAEASVLQSIAGCPDIDHLEDVVSLDNVSIQNLILCFCKIKNDSNVAISCLYGSTLNDLDKAIQLVKDSNGTVDEVSLNHVDFSESQLTDGFFKQEGVALKRLSIGSCSYSKLNVTEGAFDGIQKTLKELSLTDCNIEEVPKALSILQNLESLSLAHNQLMYFSKEHAKAHKKLKTLNLEGNFIASLEEGTLDSSAQTLENLFFGEHNFINDTFFNEIVKLKNLRVLDLSKADGISNIPAGTFKNLQKLEKLILTGCSLSSVDEKTFEGLQNLKELDLRVNLIHEVKCGSFKQTPSLQRLSLAGNFLNESKSCMWDGLNSIEEIDLGWNEFGAIDDAFRNVAPTLRVLDFRHNTNMNETDEGALDDLKMLETLNLSDTAISHINKKTFASLSALKALDLTNALVETIEMDAFDPQAETLEKLLLGNTRLRRISAQVISKLNHLKQLDLSNNKWICDIEIKPVIEAIHAKYKDAARNGKEFVLENANDTVCDRPYSLRGQTLTAVNESLLVGYNVRLDTTTTTLKPTTASAAITEQEPAVTITLFPKESAIGDEEATGPGHGQTATRLPPEYDINSISPFGTEQKKSNAAVTWIAVSALLVITLAVAVAVGFYIKKRRRNLVVSGDTEMKIRARKEEL